MGSTTCSGEPWRRRQSKLQWRTLAAVSGLRADLVWQEIGHTLPPGGAECNCWDRWRVPFLQWLPHSPDRSRDLCPTPGGWADDSVCICTIGCEGQVLEEHRRGHARGSCWGGRLVVVSAVSVGAATYYSHALVLGGLCCWDMLEWSLSCSDGPFSWSVPVIGEWSFWRCR